MSFTCIVPPTVPSVLHSSRPVMPSSAENSSALFKTVKAFGAPRVVLLMPFTCTGLPATSVFHSSTPATPSLAEKYKALLNTVSPETRETAPTRTVPATSLFHSSAPATPSAEKYKALLNTVKPDGEESPVGLMSFTKTALPGVPLVFHSSKPVPPSSAEKYSSLLNTVKPESPFGLMSFTKTALPGVPLVFHSSKPVPPSAEKYSSLLNTVKPDGKESPERLMSFTCTVPNAVPSLFHSLGPVPSSAEKNHAPLKKANSEGKRPLPPGEECPAPGLMSFTKTVPMALPSVFHSSKPLTPSLAARSMMLGELALLAPPPHPANAKADASARALVTLHSGPIECSSRWIMAPTFHPRDRPRLSLQLRPCSRNAFYLPACRILALVRCGVIVHMPGSASPRPG